MTPVKKKKMKAIPQECEMFGHILLVGERENVASSVTGTRYAAAKDAWERGVERHGLRYLLRRGAFEYGSSRRRLELLTLAPDREHKWACNLHSPGSSCDWWNRHLARYTAELLWKEWRGPMVVLGRRAQAAMETNCVPGVNGPRDVLQCSARRAFRCDGAWPVLCLPHPSGACREWNSSDVRAEVEREVRCFLVDCDALVRRHTR